MSGFETRYNAMERAQLLMIQRLVLEIAEMKGEAGAGWIDEFRNAVVSEISDIKSMEGGPAPIEITRMAHSVVAGVASLAKERYEQRRGEETL